MKKYSKLIQGICVFILYLLVPIIVNSFLPSIAESSFIELVIRTIIDICILSIFILLYKDEFKTSYIEMKKNKYNMFYKGIIYFLIIIFVVAVSNMLLDFMFPQLDFANSNVIDGLFDSSMWYILFTIFIYSSVIECIVFKKIFRDIIINDWFYIVLSAIVYALFQIGYNFTNIYSLVSTIPFILMGGISTYAYVKSKNIYLPIYIQILYNLFVLIGTIAI